MDQDESSEEFRPSTSAKGRRGSRGRVRGRSGRPRGRGRGRGQRQPRQEQARGSKKGRRVGKRIPNLDEFDEDRVKRLQRQRAEDIKTSLERLSREQMLSLLSLILTDHPGLLFDVWERAYAATSTSPASPRSPSPPASPHRANDIPKWCRCTNCREMDTDMERLCCNLLPENCISRSAAFELIALDPHVLQVANWYRHDVLAVDPGYDHRSKRHSGYRQYTLWRHGRLGVGVRLVIPSCVVWRIRNTYPSPNGQYTGFIPFRLG